MSIFSILLAVWGFISDTLGIVSTVGEFNRKYPAIAGKRIRSFRSLKSRLQRKYPKTKFHITDNKNKFNQLIAQELINIIDLRNSSQQVASELNQHKVKVGIVCGPMALNSAQWIDKHHRLEKNRYSRVLFVAMNKAGEMETYYYSANYLALLFSKIFPGSGSIAYTNNVYDRERLDRYRSDIDVLLCSVGSTYSGEKTYVDEWQARLPKELTGGAQLNETCIGDFCLTPVDADGKIAVNPAMEDLLRSELDPYPKISFIREIKRSDEKPYVIFPVNTTATKTIRDRGAKPDSTRITGKEIITRAVLRSGVVNICILDSTLARNLERAVGGFLIHHISARPANNNPLRKARAYDIFRKEEREIAIFDPNYRLDALDCTIDSSLHPPLKTTETIPSIIISELTYEDDHFNWAEGVGSFAYQIDGTTYRFAVDKDVRRPGMWAIMSALQGMRRYARKYWPDPPKSFSVWDLGCGCGIIGILMERLSNGMVGKVLFSDIDSRAVACTERNLSNLNVQAETRLRTADLFAAAEPNEKFHFIVFNPPFMPMSGITNMGHQADAGGESGQEPAVRFCECVYDYLADDGWAIIVVPDYIDNGRLQKILEARFGEEQVFVHNRFILYPFKPKGDSVPTSFEIKYQETIEKNCNYNFETCYLGDEKYLSFRMRHYLARRAVSKSLN